MEGFEQRRDELSALTGSLWLLWDRSPGGGAGEMRRLLTQLGERRRQLGTGLQEERR